MKPKVLKFASITHNSFKYERKKQGWWFNLKKIKIEIGQPK